MPIAGPVLSPLLELADEAIFTPKSSKEAARRRSSLEIGGGSGLRLDNKLRLVDILDRGITETVPAVSD